MASKRVPCPGMHILMVITPSRIHSSLIREHQHFRWQQEKFSRDHGALHFARLLLHRKESSIYEFYNPSIESCQLGFGYGPIKLYFADLLKPWDLLPSGLVYDWIKALTPQSELVDISSWRFFIFSLGSFKSWWQEWKNNLFCNSSKLYHQILNPEYNKDGEVRIIPSLNHIWFLPVNLFMPFFSGFIH